MAHIEVDFTEDIDDAKITDINLALAKYALDEVAIGSPVRYTKDSILFDYTVIGSDGAAAVEARTVIASTLLDVGYTAQSSKIHIK
jgi:hypothetical protein